MTRPTGTARNSRTILYLNYTSIEQARDLNQLGSYQTDICSDRAGAFDRVVAILFPSGRRATLDLGPAVTLVDFDVPEVLWLAKIRLAWVANALRGVAYLAFVLWTIARTRPCLIEATEPYVRGVMALVVSRLTRRPYAVQGSRDFDLDYQLSGIVAGRHVYRWRVVAKWVERIVLRNADALIADRRYYARYMLANGGDPRRLVLGRVIVDPVYYVGPDARPDALHQLNLEGRRLLLYVGRLAEDKHVMDLLHCLQEVRRTHNVDLVLAGRGPLQAAMEDLASAHAIRSHVHFTGALPLRVLASLMSQSAVILGPHMGLTLVEAALSATPIVAYGWEWHDEVITDRVTGRLVSFRDWRAMATATAELLSNRELARALGDAAREYCVANHDHDAVLQQYRTQLSAVLGASVVAPLVESGAVR